MRLVDHYRSKDSDHVLHHVIEPDDLKKIFLVFRLCSLVLNNLSETAEVASFRKFKLVRHSCDLVRDE